MKIRTFTLTLIAGVLGTASFIQAQAQKYSFADLPGPITSFGAVADGDWIYVYGGHTGESHEYTADTTLDDFIRIARDGSGEWQTLESGVRSQGASLVAHAGNIYRIGGMSPQENEIKDPGDAALNSLDDFARFAPETGKWEQLTSMPAGRSSHDSVVVGDKLYVVGGWQMSAEADSAWHDVMFVADLSADRIEWEALPQPFQRRAIAVGAVNGRIYAMGGMDADNETSLEVDVFDIESGEWSKGPELPTGVMKGFGAAATAVGGRLYVSPYSKAVLRLSEDGSAWETTAELDDFRFFHRIVPVDKDHLVAIGGASRADGQARTLEVIRIARRSPLADSQ